MAADAFKCYSALFQRMRDVGPDRPDGPLILTVCLQLIFVISHTGRTVNNKGLDNSSRPALAPLYRRWIKALVSSSVLEHATQALFRLQASSQAALGAGRAAAAALRQRLGEARSHLQQAIHSTIEPHLNQPILSLCPRPLATPNADADLNVRSLLPTLRTLLSGTCVQYWLGRELLEWRFWFDGGEGPTHGLPAHDLRAALPLRGRISGRAVNPVVLGDIRDFLVHMNTCTTVWQVTVSGPLPSARHPALGGAAAASLPPSAEPLTLPPNMPFSATNVFDMAAAVLAALARRGPELAAAGLATDTEVTNLMRLVVRLVSELRPAAAGRRLPGLWRSVAAVLGGLGACAGMQPSFEHFNPIMKTTTWLLTLGLDVPAPGSAPVGPPPPQQQQQQQRRKGQRRPQEAGQPDEAAPLGAPPPPAARGVSLRCALQGGFLPGLEQQLRRYACRPHGAPFCLTAVNVLLRAPGGWPAMLAHGSVREVASLIVTLRKAPAELDRRAAEEVAAGGVVALAIQQDVPGFSMRGVDPSTASSAQMLAYLTALLEQTLAAVFLGGDTVPESQTGDGGAAAAGTRAAAASGSRRRRQASASPAVGGCGALAFNDALEVNAPARTQLSWLAQLGGMVTHGSPEARQQRTLAMFALTQWLPGAIRARMGGWWWAAAMAAAVLAAVQTAALQCLAARLRFEAATKAVAAASADAAAAAAGAAGGGGSSDDGYDVAQMAEDCAAAAGAMACWGAFLEYEVGVFAWLGDVLAAGAHPGAPGAAAAAADAAAAAAVARALDILELLAAALPQVVSRRVALAATGATAQGGSAGGGKKGNKAKGREREKEKEKEKEKGPGGGEAVVSISEALLRRHGREGLVAALAALKGGAGGAAGGSYAEAAPPAARALGEALAGRHDLARLPVLPSPADALMAVVGVGIRRCGWPGCSNMEGPTESALAPKRCSRCKVVWYCGGACQAAHWKAGHKAECSEATPPQ